MPVTSPGSGTITTADETLIKFWIHSECLLCVPSLPEVPNDSVIIWGGLKADLPDGWLLCDGANGTLDLSKETLTYIQRRYK